MSNPQQPVDNQQPNADNGKRKRVMTLLVLVIVIAAIAYGLYYFLVARFSEGTYDTYLNGNAWEILP